MRSHFKCLLIKVTFELVCRVHPGYKGQQRKHLIHSFFNFNDLIYQSHLRTWGVTQDYKLDRSPMQCGVQQLLTPRELYRSPFIFAFLPFPRKYKSALPALKKDEMHTDKKNSCPTPQTECKIEPTSKGPMLLCSLDVTSCDTLPPNTLFKDQPINYVHHA